MDPLKFHSWPVASGNIATRSNKSTRVDYNGGKRYPGFSKDCRHTAQGHKAIRKKTNKGGRTYVQYGTAWCF